MARKPLIIWFDDKGNMLEHGDSRYANSTYYQNYKSEEAKDFDDRMTYVRLRDYTRGAARLYLQSAITGRTYSMFSDDFHDAIVAKRFVDNQLEGTFRFVKRGTGQAIQLVLENKP